MMAATLDCTIERRLLVNYRIEPGLVANLLPAPFRPQLVAGMAVGGICFIRLGGFRLGLMPRVPGVSTENAAHRFAVEWDDDAGTHVGVYVPRRDTSSRITAAGGGKIFPGVYHLAHFDVAEPDDDVRIDVASRDGHIQVAVAASPARELNSRLFASVSDAVEFFRLGASGFSPAADSRCLDAIRLDAERWDAEPMIINDLRSSVFDDRALFPGDACAVDSALIMRDLPARWTT
jgi:hypothetical protein